MADYIQSFLGWLFLIAFLFWLLTQSKPYKEGLDEFNKEQEKTIWLRGLRYSERESNNILKGDTMNELNESLKGFIEREKEYLKWLEKEKQKKKQTKEKD